MLIELLILDELQNLNRPKRTITVFRVIMTLCFVFTILMMLVGT